MKTITGLIAALSLVACSIIPSCTTVSTVRQNIATMEGVRYDELKTKVYVVSGIASHRISRSWDESSKRRARQFLVDTTILLSSDINQVKDLDITSILRGLVKRYADKFNLDEQDLQDLQDAALLVDTLVGPIKLGVDGLLTMRETQLAVALLSGIHDGLSDGR